MTAAGRVVVEPEPRGSWLAAYCAACRHSPCVSGRRGGCMEGERPLTPQQLRVAEIAGSDRRRARGVERSAM